MAEAGKLIASAIGGETATPEARALQARIRFLEARHALRERGGAGNRYTWETYLERFQPLAPELDKAVREGEADAQTQYLVGATAAEHVDVAQERLSNMSRIRYAEEKGAVEAQIGKYLPFDYDALKKCLSLQPDHLDALCHLGGSLVRYGVPRGVGMLFTALERDPRRTAPLQDLLENVVAAGILDDAEQLAQLRACIAAQGAAAREMLRAAVAKHEADRDRATDSRRQMAALGFDSPMIEADYRNTTRAKAFCQAMLAELDKQ